MSTSQPSYVCGVSDTPLLFQTVGDALDCAVERFGEREALVVRHQDVRLTWCEFREQVDALAAGLLTLGLERGDRIGIWSPNRAEWVLTQFATARLGLVLVNINPAYRIAELRHAMRLAQIDCAVLFGGGPLPTANSELLIRPLASRTWDASGASSCRACRLPSTRSSVSRVKWVSKRSARSDG